MIESDATWQSACRPACHTAIGIRICMPHGNWHSNLLSHGNRHSNLHVTRRPMRSLSKLPVVEVPRVNPRQPVRQRVNVTIDRLPSNSILIAPGTRPTLCGSASPVWPWVGWVWQRGGKCHATGRACVCGGMRVVEPWIHEEAVWMHRHPRE